MYKVRFECVGGRVKNCPHDYSIIKGDFYCRYEREDGQRHLEESRAERSGLSMVSSLGMARAREVEKMVEIVK